MELIVIAISIFLNFWLLYWKFSNGRIADGVLDLTMMVILVILFGGTASGMAAAMLGGALISIGLLIFPPNLDNLFGTTSNEPIQQQEPKSPFPDWYLKPT